jgi:hypothetical protein
MYGISRISGKFHTSKKKFHSAEGLRSKPIDAALKGIKRIWYNNTE